MMPVGKGRQSDAILYTLIAFVGLFIAATTVAVIYYVKFEDQRRIAQEAQRNLEEVVSRAEWRNRGKIIGAKQSRKTYLGTMVSHLDRMVSLIIGGVPEETSAEVKVDTVNRKVQDTLELVTPEYIDVESIDPNTTGLIRIIEKLKMRLDDVTNAQIALKKQFNRLSKRFNDAIIASFEKEQALLAEKEKYQQQVEDIRKDYAELRALLEQTSQERVQTLMVQLDEARGQRDRMHQELLKTQAELETTKDMMRRAQEELRAIVPSPDSNVAAYKPDGKIILIDDQTKIVHINIGSDDHVYRGLTFSVYDNHIPIPKDGRGKAEIEVFDIRKNTSAARIIRSEVKRPIVQGDIVANLIWDSDKINVFVVAGEFDLNNDGVIEPDAGDKIKALIEKWGGRVTDTISIETDFLVLGKAPEVLEKPTFRELEVDPLAMEKYEASLRRLTHYKEVQDRAQVLSIPVFNAERFLYFIGYKSQAATAGAFLVNRD